MRVVHVHLIDGGRDYYFGSISAIYETLSKEDMGVKYSSLLVMMCKNSEYRNKKCIVKRTRIITRSTDKTKEE